MAVQFSSMGERYSTQTLLKHTCPRVALDVISRYSQNLTSFLTLPMLRQLLSKAQGCKHFMKTTKTCHVGIHWKAFTYKALSDEYPCARVLVFFFSFFFIILSKLATSSIKVKNSTKHTCPRVALDIICRC